MLSADEKDDLGRFRPTRDVVYGGLGDDGGYGVGASEGMDPGEGDPGGMSGDDW
jgi:hypothetical protein